MTQSSVPIVSVVMPSYNHGRFIGEAVKSVLGQSFRDLELIVVDNNSTDDTDAVLAAVNDPRLRVIKFSNNGIIAASRNHGIKNSSGDYVAFIDSDDAWLPEKLRLQTEAISSNPGAVLAYSRYKTLQDGKIGGVVLPKRGRYASGKVFRELYFRPFIACSGVMARRSALQQAGGFSEDRAMLAVEDMDLWLRLSLAGEVVCASDDALFFYRVHQTNFSAGCLPTYRRTLLLARRYLNHAGLPLFLSKMAVSAVSIAFRCIFPETE